MKCHEAIVEMFEREGVDTVFTLASEEIISILSEMEDNREDRFDVVHCRHEQCAALMADGFSRVDDEIGVCITGRGPAIAQTGTALVAAANYGSDVLYLVPEPRRNTTHDGKGFEQEAYLRTMAGTVESIRSTEVLVPTIKEAFRRIRAGRGPVAVQIPTDVLERELADDTTVDSYERTSVPAAKLHPDPDKVEEAVDAYFDADATKAPVILVGRGAIAAGAKDTIEELAERMGAYIATTIQGIGHFSDHPYYLGFVGDLGPNVANEYLTESGFVLALGCSLNKHTVDKGYLLREDANIVHVDTDPTHLNRFTEVDVAVVGDAKVTATAFSEELEALDINRADEFWTEDVATEIAESSPVTDRTFEEVPGTIDPRDLVAALDDTLPRDRFIVSDVGHFGGWIFDGLRFEHTDRHIWAAEFLALGQGLPMGVGAALTETERTCMVICGDGGLMMSLQELDTAIRESVPLIVIVMNDEALGAEYHMAQMRGYSGKVGDIPAPDFGPLMEAMGGTGYTVRSVQDLNAIAEELNGELEGPILVDCKLNPEAHTRTMGTLDIE